MNLLQKLIILAKAHDNLEKSRTEALFALLDMHNVEYRSLAIPIIDLPLDKVIPADCMSEVAASYIFKEYCGMTLFFDFYLPEFKWVFNLHQSDNDLVSRALEDEISKRCQDVTDVNIFNVGDYAVATTSKGQPLNIRDLVKEAARRYFSDKGYTYPSIGNGASQFQRPESGSDLTFDNNNLAILEERIAKR